ncbi:MAG: glycosyltransferase, partial [Candidatus Saccharimonas sp.]
MKTITILIPAYNEAAVLPQLFARLEALQRSVDRRRYQFEFLFINDGSQDHTLELIQIEQQH